MAELSAPRHRELVRGMASELGAIADPAERRRFAMGAIAATLRLALSGYLGDQPMPMPSTRLVLQRHSVPFLVTFLSLTALLLANHATRLSAHDLPAHTIVKALPLALPFTMALTLPMAVFVAVVWACTGMKADGVLAAAQREPHGVRRMLTPVILVAAGIGAFTFVSNTRTLPRANARLAALVASVPPAQTDRTMTLGELRDAALGARTEAGPGALVCAAAYEVEIHKKLALAAASVVLALAGVAFAVRFRRGGVGLVLVVSGVVFAGYYAALIAGEMLAERLLISPLIAMWMPNAVLLTVLLLLVWWPGGHRAPPEAESLATSG
jgi:lipopolysaccharide export LptBFGC system permease protein LptF